MCISGVGPRFSHSLAGNGGNDTATGSAEHGTTFHATVSSYILVSVNLGKERALWLMFGVNSLLTGACTEHLIAARASYEKIEQEVSSFVACLRLWLSFVCSHPFTFLPSLKFA